MPFYSQTRDVFTSVPVNQASRVNHGREPFKAPVPIISIAELQSQRPLRKRRRFPKA